MAGVSKIFGVLIDNLSEIYGSAIDSLGGIYGVDLGGTTPSQSTDFVFDGNYTPPNADEVNFF